MRIPNSRYMFRRFAHTWQSFNPFGPLGAHDLHPARSTINATLPSTPRVNLTIYVRPQAGEKLKPTAADAKPIPELESLKHHTWSGLLDFSTDVTRTCLFASLCTRETNRTEGKPPWVAPSKLRQSFCTSTVNLMQRLRRKHEATRLTSLV